MPGYRYDIAITLCKEDAGFARKLVRELNPSLDVFFYEDRQEELIGKLGPEKFGKVFKKEARVVVILYREDWGDSFYTDIEESAIVDRTKDKKEGQQFLFVLPMEKGKSPSWYPETRIYADPFRFSTEQLALFIEFKVTERGGKVKPVTFEDKVAHLEEKMEQRKAWLKSLTSAESAEAARAEIENLKTQFDNKINFLKQSRVQFNQTGFKKTNGQLATQIKGQVNLDNCTLKLIIKELHAPQYATSQSYEIVCMLDRMRGHTWHTAEKATYRFNSDGAKLRGWSVVKMHDLQGLPYESYLIRGRGYDYDLGAIITSEALIEKWFKQLFQGVEAGYKPILQ